MSDTYIIGGVRAGDTSVKIEVITPSGDVKRHRLTLKIWESLSLSSGDVISRETYRRIAEYSEKCEAVTKTLRYLSEGTYSIKALTDKLCQKGFNKDSAEAAVALALKRGLIDEYSQACDIAEKQASRLHRGPSRIARDLTAHGYPSDLSRRAAESVPMSVYDEALDICIAKKCKNGIPEEKSERDRVIASLVRLGFSVGSIIKRMNKLSED